MLDSCYLLLTLCHCFSRIRTCTTWTASRNTCAPSAATLMCKSKQRCLQSCRSLQTVQHWRVLLGKSCRNYVVTCHCLPSIRFTSVKSLALRTDMRIVPSCSRSFPKSPCLCVDTSVNILARHMAFLLCHALLIRLVSASCVLSMSCCKCCRARWSGFSCPKGKGKGTLAKASCPAKVCVGRQHRSHTYNQL